MGRVLPTLHKQGAPLASGAAQRARLAHLPLPRSFAAALATTGLYPLRATGIEILQINVGKRCNQTCRHCHVDAGPDRSEVMPRVVLEACLSFLARAGIPTLDITGGAPELHPDYREIVVRATGTGAQCTASAVLPIPAVPAITQTSVGGAPAGRPARRCWRLTAWRCWRPCRTSRRGRPTRSGERVCSRNPSSACGA